MQFLPKDIKLESLSNARDIHGLTRYFEDSGCPHEVAEDLAHFMLCGNVLDALPPNLRKNTRK